MNDTILAQPAVLTTAREAVQPPSARGALAGLSLAMLLASLGTSVANVGLPSLAEAFGASFQAVQWVVLAYLLAVTSLIVGVGRLGDLFGRRRLLLGGILLFTVASALAGLAPSLPWLIVARAVQGIGAAAMMTLTLTFVGELVPKAKTGSAMGLLGTMSAVGTALGPSLGGMLLAGLGWRALFLAHVPLGVATWLLARRTLAAERHDKEGARRGFDVVGTALLTLTLAAYALALTTGRGEFGSGRVLLVGTAVAGLGLFVLAEKKAAAPLIRLEMFRETALSAGLGLSGLVATVLMATLVVGPFYLTQALRLEAATSGLVLSVGPVVAALMGVPAGRLTDRWGAWRTTVAGLVAIAAGCAGLAVVDPAGGVAGYLAPIVVVTAGYALFQTANNTAIMAGVATERRGVVSGLLNLARNLGLVTGTAAMGAVFARAAAGAGAGPVAAVAGTQATFAAGAALMLGALTLAWATRGRGGAS